MRPLGALTLAVALAVGAIARFDPALFFRVPHVGFVLWVMTGSRELPPTFTTDALREEHYRKWLRHGDVVVSGMPKAGTHWTLQIVHLVRSGGDDTYGVLGDTHGNVEYRLHPRDALEQRIARESAKRASPSDSIPWFSHTAPQPDLPALQPARNPSVRYIATMRPLREVITSMVPFINDRSPEFRRLWGGFPGPHLNSEDILALMLRTPRMFFTFARAWWEVRAEPNVLLLHFHDLKKDLRGEVQRVISFLGESRTDEELELVLHKAGFAYMKANALKFVIMTGPNRDIPVTEKLVNKGQMGGAGTAFTPAMNKTLESALAQHVGDLPDLMHWWEHGGEYSRE